MGFYDTKKHTISHTDMYFDKLEDCLWGYEKYNSKNDNIEQPCSCRDWFDIQILRVDENDEKYKSAVFNTSLHE